MRLSLHAPALALLLVACATVDPEVVSRADMQRRLGDIKLSKGQYEVAIREYRRSLATWPDDPETYFGLGEAYRRKGLLADAETQLREALRLDPTHHDARLNLGAVLLQQERWADAITVTQALLDDPTFIRPSRAYVNLGWAHYKAGNPDRAREAFVEALADDPASLEAHLDLGILLYEQGEVLEAIRYFDRAAELAQARPAGAGDGVEAEARFRMAQAHVKLGQLQRAIENLRVAAERGGGGQWAEKSREYLRVLQ